MVSIATIGPQGSHAWLAARQYNAEAEIKLYPHLAAVFTAIDHQETDLAVVPVYNTREGLNKEYSRLIKATAKCIWQDNVVLPIHLSLGCLAPEGHLKVIIGKSDVLRQCEEYIATSYPEANLVAIHDLEAAVCAIKENNQEDHGVIESEEALKTLGLNIREREIVPHNRTRFAVLGRALPPRSGYDATAIITTPLKDRVGMLGEILNEFATRGINLLDMQTETDPQSQKLHFAIELEGHIDDPHVTEALDRIENQVIQEPGAIRILGSFPRVDMRVKRIKKIGFIGSGEMSLWFARQLEGEGYETMITGRSTELRPEAMIPEVDLLAICVPISATPAAIEQFGPQLAPHQALVLLAGEAENVLNTALAHTKEEVEVMLVHNLWGPQAASMKDKNASVVRTRRSGVLCSEFEAFLYKHGAHISIDSAQQHDLMMGVSQKLPSAISVALAMALKDNQIKPEDIGSHSTLTSLYSILSMARIHGQNPRTYAEILATSGSGRRMVRSFAKNLNQVTELAEQGQIQELCRIIEDNRNYLTEEFIKDRMQQSLAVDETLGRVISKK